MQFQKHLPSIYYQKPIGDMLMIVKHDLDLKNCRANFKLYWRNRTKKITFENEKKKNCLNFLNREIISNVEK